MHIFARLGLHAAVENEALPCRVFASTQICSLNSPHAVVSTVPFLQTFRKCLLPGVSLARLLLASRPIALSYKHHASRWLLLVPFASVHSMLLHAKSPLATALLSTCPQMLLSRMLQFPQNFARANGLLPSRTEHEASSGIIIPSSCILMRLT